MKFGHSVQLSGLVASCKATQFDNKDGGKRTKVVVEIGLLTHSKKFFVDETPRFSDGSHLREGDAVHVTYRENSRGYAEDVVYERQASEVPSSSPKPVASSSAPLKAAV